MYLVLNVGSSSLKLSAYGDGGTGGADLLCRLEVGGLGTGRLTARAFRGGAPDAAPPDVAGCQDHHAVLRVGLDWIERLGLPIARVSAIGHRVVHGGATFEAPVVIDAETRARLGALAQLAPLHMPQCLAVIDVLSEAQPSIPQIACFDTAFHATMPEVARRLPLPEAYDRAGYRRYGFHGLSCEWAVAELARRNGRLPSRLVVLHLGNGASVTAIHDGISVATTMGFSALDGLVMGTRTGSLDPGVVIALMRDRGLGVAEVERLLYHEGGLLALSGESSDMRTLLASSSARAAFAIEHYCLTAARNVGSLAVALGGIDALAFTGGIGENAAPVRARICAHLAWLGVEIDLERNSRSARVVSSASSPIEVAIVDADEERVILGHVQRLEPWRSTPDP